MDRDEEIKELARELQEVEEHLAQLREKSTRSYKHLKNFQENRVDAREIYHAERIVRSLKGRVNDIIDGNAE